jgi:hypothetical protein
MWSSTDHLIIVIHSLLKLMRVCRFCGVKYGSSSRVWWFHWRHAAARWIHDVRITQVHGVPHIVKNFVVIPMLHPATALYQPSNRAILEADFVALGEYINTHFPDATV